MYDPKSLAFEIFLGKRERKKPKNKFGNKYRSPIITIWHKDPESDGTDDSCGWFIRSRHVDQTKLEKAKIRLTGSFEDWFDENGSQRFSTSGTLLGFYEIVSHVYFDENWKKANKFCQKNLAHIMFMAENRHDCMGDTITGRWVKYDIEVKKKKGVIFDADLELRAKLTSSDRITELASFIFCDVARRDRKWWQHPRWHIHHWQVRFNFLHSFYRRYFERCSICREGFKGSSNVYTDWDNKKKWCGKCDELNHKPVPCITENF